MGIAVGATAQHPNGSVVTWNGRTWVETTPPRAPASARARSSGGAPSREDSAQLGHMRDEAQASAEVERSLQRARQANTELNSGPWRGAFLDAMIPTENDGIIGSVVGNTIGAVARATGAVPQRDVENYMLMQRARNQGVLAEQRTQRGVQTESDAARMAMAGLNVRNPVENNETVIRQGVQDAIRAQARAAFYSKWASVYGGLNGTRDSHGRSADEGWAAYQPQWMAHYLSQRGLQGGAHRAATPAPPTIRRIR